MYNMHALLFACRVDGGVGVFILGLWHGGCMFIYVHIENTRHITLIFIHVYIRWKQGKQIYTKNMKIYDNRGVKIKIAHAKRGG